jgi:hypothetical protein
LTLSSSEYLSRFEHFAGLHVFQLMEIHAAFAFQHAKAAMVNTFTAINSERLQPLRVECPLSADPIHPALILHIVC